MREQARAFALKTRESVSADPQGCDISSTTSTRRNENAADSRVHST